MPTLAQLCLAPFLAASVDFGDFLLVWVPEFQMSRPLALVAQSSPVDQPCCLWLSVPLSLGDSPPALLLVLPCSYFSPPMALAYSCPNTSCILHFVDDWFSDSDLFSWDWGKEWLGSLSTLCEHTPECLKHFSWVRGMAVVFTLVKVAREGKRIWFTKTRRKWGEEHTERNKRTGGDLGWDH